MSSIYRSSPFRSTWNTGYITGLDMCPVCTDAVHSVALGTRVTLQVWTCVKYVPKPVHSVALGNTGYITGLDMCQVYTEAVHSVALGTRVTLQVLDMCQVYTEAVHSVALGTRVTLQVWTCVKYIPEAVHSVALGNTGLHYRFGHVSSMLPKQSIP